MSNRSKVLRTLLVLGIVACIAGAGVFSAFSSKTENPGNVITAGTVTLKDDDGGSALYALNAAKPGDSQTSCIDVSYTGSLPATVKLFTQPPVGELGPYVTLKVEAGTQTTPSFPGCEGFTAYTTGGTVYEGTLAAFAAANNSFANGIDTNPTGQTRWESGNSVVYRFTATLAATAPEAAQGKTTGTHAIVWEAQNQ